MAVMDHLIGLVSPAAALRRANQLRESGKEAEAFPLLTRAAKAGFAAAEYAMACSYLEGRGVPASRVEGIRWLKRAAGHNHIDAQASLSSLLLRGLASEAEDEEANWDDSQLFATEAAAIEPDFEAGAKWARKAAAAGSAQAQALLGYVLTSGPVPMRNPEEARRWYERSAASGCPQGHLGFALSLAQHAKDASDWRRVTEELRHAADGGLPTAIFLLAVLNDEGRLGIERKPAQAALLYKKAAELGFRSAQLRFGLALIEGRGIEQDLAAGETWLRRAAQAGDAEAATLVGDLYSRGGLLPPNYAEAVTWYRRAAEAGHAKAARAIGSMYLTGAGQLKDEKEGVRWLRRAAEAGDDASRIDLANLVARGGGDSEDPTKIAGWFTEAAASGDLVAAFNLGLCLAKGVGTERDDKQAALWLRRAAEGIPEAQYMYGRLLADGRGIAADLPAARSWFERAAAAGLTDAEVALAEMLLNGRGGDRSPAEAAKLFQKAAAKGHSGAMFGLGALFAAGRDVLVDRPRAEIWFRAAAERGHGHAQFMLGRYLTSGAAGNLDPVEGRKWLERAMAQGVAEAEPELAAAQT